MNYPPTKEEFEARLDSRAMATLREFVQCMRLADLSTVEAGVTIINSPQLARLWCYTCGFLYAGGYINKLIPQTEADFAPRSDSEDQGSQGSN